MVECLPNIWICSPSQYRNIKWKNIKVLWYFTIDEPKFDIPSSVKKVRIKDSDRSKDWIPNAKIIFDNFEGQVLYWGNSHSYDKAFLFVRKFVEKQSGLPISETEAFTSMWK
jgi:hypothetical protein